MHLFKLLANLLTWMALRAVVNRPFLVSLSRSDSCLLARRVPCLWMLERLGLTEEIEPLRYRITAAGIRALGMTQDGASRRLEAGEDARLVVVTRGVS